MADAVDWAHDRVTALDHAVDAHERVLLATIVVHQLGAHARSDAAQIVDRPAAAASGDHVEPFMPGRIAGRPRTTAARPRRSVVRGQAPDFVMVGERPRPVSRSMMIGADVTRRIAAE